MGVNRQKANTTGTIPYAHWLAKCVDATIIYLTGLMVFWGYFHHPLWQSERYHWMVSLASLAAVFLLSSNGVYRSWRGAVLIALVVRLCRGFLCLGAVIVAYLYLTKAGHHFSRLWFVSWLMLAFTICVLVRACVYRTLQRMRIHGYNVKSVALFGTQKACTEVFTAVCRERFSGFRVEQVRLLDADTAPCIDIDDVACFRPEYDGTPTCHEIWLCLPLSRGNAVADILQVLRHSTANIRFFPDLRSFRLINHQVSYIVGYYALDLSISPMQGWQRTAKWVEDKLIAVMALLLLCPFFVLISLWILLADGKPVFYRQARVGWNGQVFNIIKFRTMIKDCEAQNVVWGCAEKKQTIPLGRLMRRLSIDELPQFWNVLTGDMSVVGPRPERPQFVAQFKEEIPGYMQKHMVKAGLTGWAQVEGWRGDTDLKQRINHDLWYIENWSVWLDMKIIFLTILRLFNHSSAC